MKALALSVLLLACASTALAAINADPGLESWAVDPNDNNLLKLTDYSYFWSADNRKLVLQETADVYDGQFAARLTGHANDGTFKYDSYQHGAGIAAALTKADVGPAGTVMDYSFKYKVVAVGNDTSWGGLLVTLATSPCDPWGGNFYNDPGSFTPTALSTGWQTFTGSYTISAGTPANFYVSILNWGGFSESGGQIIVDDVQVTPEPATLSLLGLGALLIRRRR